MLGSLNVIRLAAELMERNEPDKNQWRGCIVNTAGVEGIRGTTGQVSTAAASGAIIGNKFVDPPNYTCTIFLISFLCSYSAMTQPLAYDLLESGIRVVTIAPGLFNTPLTEMLPTSLKADISRNCMIAPNRLGEPAEYAYLVTTCINNPHINGSVIELDAGFDICY